MYFYYMWHQLNCLLNQASVLFLCFSHLLPLFQTSSMPMWPWRCKMWRVPQSPYEGTSHVGNKTSCCEYHFDNVLTSNPNVTVLAFINVIVYTLCAKVKYLSLNYMSVQNTAIKGGSFFLQLRINVAECLLMVAAFLVSVNIPGVSAV